MLEEYLTYLATEAEGVNNYRADLTNLRGLLETIGKLYGYPHLEILFLASDLPRQVQPKLKSYSDSELIRFNVALAELDEQMERLMVIHQMLGTRISDTLTSADRLPVSAGRTSYDPDPADENNYICEAYQCRTGTAD